MRRRVKDGVLAEKNAYLSPSLFISLPLCSFSRAPSDQVPLVGARLLRRLRQGSSSLHYPPPPPLLALLCKDIASARTPSPSASSFLPTSLPPSISFLSFGKGGRGSLSLSRFLPLPLPFAPSPSSSLARPIVLCKHLYF